MYFLIIDWGGGYFLKGISFYFGVSLPFSPISSRKREKNYATALLTFQHPFSVEISSYLKIG